jgi:putative redox protein
MLSMVTITARYDGDLSTTATHGPSGATIRTDAPKDNEGQGRFFSPTDLVASALGSCMLTIMGIVARRHDLDIRGATVKVVKEMNQSPRRIGKLSVVIAMPGMFTSEQRQMLENAAQNCPVHKSMHPDVAMPIRFEWSGS